MSSQQKTISISPEFFSSGDVKSNKQGGSKGSKGRNATLKREKKPRPAIPKAVSSSTLRRSLLAKIKDHQRRERYRSEEGEAPGSDKSKGGNGVTNGKAGKGQTSDVRTIDTEPRNAFDEEFQKSLAYLSALAHTKEGQQVSHFNGGSKSPIPGSGLSRTTNNNNNSSRANRNTLSLVKLPAQRQRRNRGGGLTLKRNAGVSGQLTSSPAVPEVHLAMPKSLSSSAVEVDVIPSTKVNFGSSNKQRPVVRPEARKSKISYTMSKPAPQPSTQAPTLAPPTLKLKPKPLLPATASPSSKPKVPIKILNEAQVSSINSKSTSSAPVLQLSSTPSTPSQSQPKPQSVVDSSSNKPYGVLKGGTKPTYREYFKLKPPKSTLGHNVSMKNYSDRKSTPSISSQNVVPASQQLATERARQHTSGDEPLRLTTPSNQKGKGKGRQRRTIRKTTTKRRFKLGKDSKKKVVSVLIKNNNTRRKVKHELGELKRTPLFDVKQYLKNHGLLKVGSSAPPDVLRKIYEQSVLTGDVFNMEKDTLIHNYLNDN
jgi:hypothetical protein